MNNNYSKVNNKGYFVILKVCKYVIFFGYCLLSV